MVIWKTLNYSCPEHFSLRAVCDDSTHARLLLCYLPVLPCGLQNEILYVLFFVEVSNKCESLLEDQILLC